MGFGGTKLKEQNWKIFPTKLFGGSLKSMYPLGKLIQTDKKTDEPKDKKKMIHLECNSEKIALLFIAVLGC